MLSYMLEDDFDYNFEYTLEERQKYLPKTTDTIENKTNKNEEEIKMANESVMMSNGFSGAFDFSKMFPNMKTDVKISMSMMGCGIVSKDGSETIVYENGELTSLPFVGMVMEPMIFPHPVDKIKAGDMILHNKNINIVIEATKTKITVINPQTEVEYRFVPKKSAFIKEGFIAKVMTFDGIDFDGDNTLPMMMMMMGGNNTMQGNMMLPMMMMMKSSDDMSSMLPMMMMMGGNQQQQNPMMMLAMMNMLKKDKKTKVKDSSTKGTIDENKEDKE